MPADKGNPNFSQPQPRADNATEDESTRRWHRLCRIYLPVTAAETFWRFSRRTRPAEPAQGWKLHISATVLQACDLFEKVAPFLSAQNARFKAPDSLRELIDINSGLKYGYWQVGKFITVYPATREEAVRLAGELDALTREFTPIAVPFDKQYAPASSVYYRYGAFRPLAITIADGLTLPAVRNLAGEIVYDDRLRPVPDWLTDPFPAPAAENSENAITPLATTYKVFRALTQRGKGGTYQALDLSTNPPRFCVVKEGRRHGEAFWNGQDGYRLVRHEHRVLEKLGPDCPRVPQVYASFEADENFYLVMEYVEGVSLASVMKRRRRRFSIRQIIACAAEIAEVIEEIHRAGWIWNDCKPQNLIVTADRRLRPIDFENACPANGGAAPFDWKSRGFSKPGRRASSAAADDLYAFGAVLYFLLTGRFYKPQTPVAIGKFRRRVPPQLKAIVAELVGAGEAAKPPSLVKTRRRLKKLLD